MADTFKKSFYRFILLFVLVSVILTGCGLNKKGPKSGGTDNPQSAKKSPPKPLVSLENTTEMMVNDLQKVMDNKLGVPVKMKAQTPEKSGSEEGEKDGQDKDKGQEQNKNKGDNKGQGEGKSTGNKQAKETKKDKSGPQAMDWTKMQKNVEKLQNTWATYGAMAAKDGATNTLLKDFEKQLDILTTKVMEKQENDLADLANNLYGYFPKFYDLYKHQAPPNIKDMKYQIRKITMEAERDDWTETGEGLKSLNESWEMTKSRIEKPDLDLNRKIQRAIDGFSRSVKEENKYLAKIKGMILIKHLEEIK